MIMSTAFESPATFRAAEFTERRRAIQKRVEPGAIVLVQGDSLPGGFQRFRQSNKFHYLCGLEVAHAYLLIEADTGLSTIFVPHRNSAVEESESRVPAAEDVEHIREATGVDAVLGLEALAPRIARSLLEGCRLLYTPASPAEGRAGSRDELLRASAARAADPWSRSASREGEPRKLLSARFPQLELRDLSPILDSLRSVRTSLDIERLRLAGRLSALGITEAMGRPNPVFSSMSWPWSPPLFRFQWRQRRSVPSNRGERTPTFGSPHYHRNDARLREGDLVLMDYAPDVA
jgi:Xaa-Pro aminopeptidase